MGRLPLESKEEEEVCVEMEMVARASRSKKVPLLVAIGNFNASFKATHLTTKVKLKLHPSVGCMEMSEAKRRVLLLTDNVFIPVNAVLASVIDSSLGLDLSARDDVFVIVAPSFRGKLPIESGSLDVTVSVSKSLELVDEEWVEVEISSSYAGNVSNLGVKSLVSANQEERSESYSIAAAFDHITSHTRNVKSNRAASTCFLLKSFSCPTLPSLWHKDSMAFIRLTIRKVKEVSTSSRSSSAFFSSFCLISTNLCGKGKCTVCSASGSKHTEFVTGANGVSSTSPTNFPLRSVIALTFPFGFGTLCEGKEVGEVDTLLVSEMKKIIGMVADMVDVADRGFVADKVADADKDSHTSN
ncbi:hypothetical protein ZIOFF_043501 [Zingiber officinale]|uniref:Uncharacterized protein n=1 Tax=Zingiber officinale TaxID=94328 RepID=A0A8J5FVE8_ZINOF|nr:hypothetical protein ZIOFF_043501 [Zingiber officinale]